MLHDKSGLVKTASVRFSMKNMDMGYNEFSFNSEQAGEWKAKAILPVCTAGRSDWFMELMLKAADVRVLFRFVIEV
jgi:hypothetical protein